MRKGLGRRVGIFSIVLGALFASAAFADGSTATGADSSATAQVHFKIIIPEEVSAVFESGSESTPFVYSNAGSFTYTLAGAQASNYATPSQLAAIPVP